MPEDMPPELIRVHPRSFAATAKFLNLTDGVAIPRISICRSSVQQPHWETSPMLHHAFARINTNKVDETQMSIHRFRRFSQIRTAARSICENLENLWMVLQYHPESLPIDSPKIPIDFEFF
jgi:hypothetical protein